VQTEGDRNHHPHGQPRVLDLPHKDEQPEVVANPGDKKRHAKEPIASALGVYGADGQDEGGDLQGQKEAEAEGEVGMEGPGQDPQIEAMVHPPAQQVDLGWVVPANGG